MGTLMRVKTAKKKQISDYAVFTAVWPNSFVTSEVC